MSFFDKLNKQVKKVGGTQETLEVVLRREKLTLAEYRPNWADFVSQSIKWIQLDKAAQKEFRSNFSAEKRTLCRLHNTGDYRIKLVRSGIKVPLDGHTDILVPTLGDAIATLEMIAKGFADGDLDDAIATWMKDKDNKEPKQKVGESDLDFQHRHALYHRPKKGSKGDPLPYVRGRANLPS
jgi:hypothetical protein